MITDIFQIPFLGSTVGEVLAIGFSLLYLILAIKRRMTCWIFAGLGSILYLFLMLKANLYMQTVLQLFYLIMALYGWYQWKNNQKSDKEDIVIVKWPLKNHLIAILIVLSLTFLNGTILKNVDQAAAPYLDAFILWGSILTTWMVARRILENWLYWFIIDLFAAYLYYTQGLTATAGLFILYTLMVIYGYVDWKNSSKTLAQ